MKFVEFEARHADAYRRFCEALTGHPDTSPSTPFGYYGASPGIIIKRHLIVDDASGHALVIGAADVKIQQYVLGGEIVQIAAVVYPVSLGAVDARYGMAGLFLFKKLTEHYPLNFMLGMGNPEQSAAARLGRAMGWTLQPIPYLFMPMRLGPLLHKLVAGRRLVAGAIQGATRLGFFRPADALLRVSSASRGQPNGALGIRRVLDFDASIDAFWRAYAREVGFSLVRDAAQLNAMFPGRIEAFQKLTMQIDDRAVGYAVLLVPPAADGGRFGNATVATLVELGVLQEYTTDAARALRRHLYRTDLDAVITNMSHARTVSSLERAGFRTRPTNMFLAASKQLQALLRSRGIAIGDMVITRGDGDGPVGLGVNL
jgi:hypothetical protein